MAENEGKSSNMVMVYHQKLFDLSFQPELALFYCREKYQIHLTSMSTPKTAILAKKWLKWLKIKGNPVLLQWCITRCYLTCHFHQK